METREENLRFILDPISGHHQVRPRYTIMTWKWLHDSFVFMLHQTFRKNHRVILDLDFLPAKPVCLTCQEKKDQAYYG